MNTSIGVYSCLRMEKKKQQMSAFQPTHTVPLGGHSLHVNAIVYNTLDDPHMERLQN